MKTSRLPLLLALSAVLLTPVLRASDVTPASDGILYVTIETFEPIKFHELRSARAQSGELVLNTLKKTADVSAQLAGMPNGVVVLDEGAPAPEGAPVLRLTWTDGRRTVAADLIENGKNHYLGIVSRKSLLSHPDRKRLMRTLNSAAQPDAYNDASVRTETEMNLYFALKLIADRRARIAAKS